MKIEKNKKYSKREFGAMFKIKDMSRRLLVYCIVKCGHRSNQELGEDRTVNIVYFFLHKDNWEKDSVQRSLNNEIVKTYFTSLMNSSAQSQMNYTPKCLKTQQRLPQSQWIIWKSFFIYCCYNFVKLPRVIWNGLQIQQINKQPLGELLKCQKTITVIIVLIFKKKKE